MGPLDRTTQNSNYGMIPAIIGLAASILGPMLANRAAKKQQERANKYNEAQNELAYQRELELREYNEPKNQMSRFGEAGLNPNLIYGQNNQGGGSYTPSRDVGRPFFNPLEQIPQAIGMYQQFRMREAQINSVEASTEQKRADILNKGLMAGLMKLKGQREEHALNREPALTAIANNKAQGSEAILRQEWQKLLLMKQKEQMNLLEQSSKRLGMDEREVRIESLGADLIFKRYRNEWMKQGITTSDNPVLRIFMRMLGESGLGFSDLKDVAGDGLEKLGKDFAPQIDTLKRMRQDILNSRPTRFRYKNNF